MSKRKMAIKSIVYKNSSFDISYIISNSSLQNSIIILHGWGSNKELMHQALDKDLKNFKTIYIDLPGFGKSSNSQILTTQDYSKIIDIFLSKLNISKDIIIGHSFGGKVAMLLNPKLLVLISSAGIVEKKKLAIKINIAFFKLLKKVGLGRFYKLFASSDANQLSINMYETFKNVVNEDFSPKFEQFKNKALILWGKEDSATTLESGKKIESLVPSASFKVYDGDHYFFMNHSKDISQEINKVYNEL